MNQEIALYERELCWLLEYMHHTVNEPIEWQLHWHPAQAQANSSAAVINHMLASTRICILWP